MSLAAHPNFHAVLFVTSLGKIVFGDRRVPETVEMLDAYFKSLRGKATPDTDIDFDGMMGHFQNLVKDRLQFNDTEGVGTFLTSFGCEVSVRLDEQCSADE